MPIREPRNQLKALLVTLIGLFVAAEGAILWKSYQAVRLITPLAEREKKSKDGQSTAFKHWQAGLLHFQKGDRRKARQEWLLCRRLDPGHEDCNARLKRLELPEDLQQTTDTCGETPVVGALFAPPQEPCGPSQ